MARGRKPLFTLLYCDSTTPRGALLPPPLRGIYPPVIPFAVGRRRGDAGSDPPPPRWQLSSCSNHQCVQRQFVGYLLVRPLGATVVGFGTAAGIGGGHGCTCMHAGRREIRVEMREGGEMIWRLAGSSSRSNPSEQQDMPLKQKQMVNIAQSMVHLCAMPSHATRT